MIRTKLQRKLSTSTITAHILSMKDGAAVATPLEPLTVCGALTNAEAIRVLKKTYGKGKMYSVEKIDIEENMYEMNVDDFLKIATKVEKN